MRKKLGSSPRTKDIASDVMPDIFDEVATQTAPKDIFDEVSAVKRDIFDEVSASPEVVASEAQRATTGAVQALDVMAAPQQLNWSDVNEKLDAERFYESESLRAQAALDPTQAPALLAQSREARQGITPYTTTGQQLNRTELAEQQGRVQSAATAARPGTPASLLSSALGPALSANVQPAIEASARNFGGATGGALGAALGAAATAGTGGLAPLAFGIGSALMGSVAGGFTQEKILESTETPEETIARQARAAEDVAANPNANRIGGALASLPFFGPSLAQFGRAASGDMGAITNLGLSGAIGAGTEIGVAKFIRGEDVKPEDVAAAFFSNVILNEPTKLGRRLGLHPSTEQQAIEDAQQKYAGGPPRVGEGLDLQSGLNTRGTTSTDNVFSSVPNLRIMRQARELMAQQEAAPSEVPPIPIGERPSSASLSSMITINRAAGNRVKLIDGSFEVLNPLGGVDQDGIMTTNGFVDPNLVTELQDASGNVLWSKPGEPNAQQISPASPPDGGVRPPEVPSEDALLPTNEGGEGVQPSGQGEPLVEAAPEAPREIAEPPPVPVEEATAAEASRAPADLPGATSNKEAVVNAERAARELDPIIKEARISNAESIDRAQQIVTQNPLRPQEIVTRLRENPQERTISLEDSAVLLVERTKLNNARRELLDRAADESLDPTERAAAKAEFETIEGRLNELDQAAQDARSTWGRFGQLWQRSMREDFTLAALERKARVRKGEALTPEESAQVKTIADEVAAEQVKADAAIAKAEDVQIEKRVDEVIAASAKQPDDIPAPLMQRFREYMQRVSAAAEFQAQKAEEALRVAFEKSQRLGAVPSAPDPILGHVIDLAFAKVVKGAADFGGWSAEMVSKWGSRIEPYLKNAWDAATAKANSSVDSFTLDKKKRAAVQKKLQTTAEQQGRVTQAMVERLKEGASIDELSRYVDKLVDTFVQGGVRDRGALVAAVKGVLEPLAPGITDRKVGELISGYGQSSQLSKDPLKVVKRDLKGQLQQVSKLEALAAKEPLRKTGPERRTASDEERRLIKQVNEAKKAAGVVTTDPETQLKSTMDSARTRFVNQIKDLTLEIETGQRPPDRTPIQYDEDIQILRGLRDRLKETLQALDGPKEITEEQRIRITTRGLLDSISALDSQIAGAQPKIRRAAPDTPEIRVLKAKRDALRAELAEINAADSLLMENRKAEGLVRSIERAEAELAGTSTRPAQQGPESQLVTEAREQLAAVREQIKAKNDADPAVQQARMDAAEAAVERAIKKLDEQLQAGDISVKRAPSPAGSQRLEDLRMQRDAMNRLRNQLRIEARPKPNALDVAIKARKAQLKRQEADYEARIAAGDFAPRTRKAPLDLSSSPEALDALARVQAVKDKFSKLQEEWKWANMTPTERAAARLWTGWQATKNAMFSFDISAPLQLAFSMASHPIEGAKAIGKGVVAGIEQFVRNSQKFSDREKRRIANSPNYKKGLMKEAGLELTVDSYEENAGSVLEKLADLESNWKDIPRVVKGLLGLNGRELVKGTAGIAKALPKIYGMGIKASNVAYNTMANHMRARAFDSIIARWYKRRGSVPTKQQLQLIGELVNVATGRGGIKGEKMISKILYAPNYYLSLVKQLVGDPIRKAIFKHEGAATREITEEYVRASATVITLQGLVYLFGNRDKQTLDPRSAKLGRLITDQGTQIDATMGRGAYLTLAAQLISGQGYDKKGRLQDRDRLNTLLAFVRGRLSREITTGLTVPFGKDFRGKDLDVKEIAKDQLIPLAWRDVDEVLKREGMTRGTFIQLLNLMGASHKLAE